MAQVAHVEEVAAVALNTLSMAEAKRHLKRSFDAGDVVRPSKLKGTFFVSSQTDPSKWHATSLKACDCKGHTNRGICRHRVRVSWELHQLKKQAAA